MDDLLCVAISYILTSALICLPIWPNEPFLRWMTCWIFSRISNENFANFLHKKDLSIFLIIWYKEKMRLHIPEIESDYKLFGCVKFFPSVSWWTYWWLKLYFSENQEMQKYWVKSSQEKERQSDRETEHALCDNTPQQFFDKRRQ